MAEVSQEMILEYMIRKGGLVKNVDLVKHFRKFLQVDDAQQKDRAREIFKERVNTVAYIKAEKGEKYLHLRPEFQPVGSLSRPPTGRPSASSIEDNRYNLRSSTHKEPPVSDNRSSLTSPLSLTSPTSILSGSDFTDPREGSAAMSSRSDIVLRGYKPVSSPPPQPTSVVSSHTTNSTPSYSSSKPSGSVFSPPSSSLGSGLGGGLGGDDFGSSLLAELDSFGTLFESFGTGLSSSSSSKPSQPTKSSLSSYETGSSSVTKPSVSSYGTGSNSSSNRTNKPGLSSYGSGSNSSLPSTDQTSSMLGYGSKSKQPSVSTYATNSSSSSLTHGSGHEQTTKWSSPTYSGTSSAASKSTNMSPAQGSVYKTTSSTNSLQSGTSVTRNAPTESAGDLSDLLSAFGSTSTTTKYTPSSSSSNTSRKNDSAGDLSDLLSTFGSTSLSSTTKTQSPSPKRPAPQAPPASYQNKISQAPQQRAAPTTPSSSRGASTSEQQPSSSGPSTPKTSLGNLHGYRQPSTPPKRPAPGIPTASGTASPKTSSSSLGSAATKPRSQLNSGGYGAPISNSSPREVTPPRSSFTSPPPQSTTTTNKNLSSGGLGVQPKHTSTSDSQLGTTTTASTANKTDYSSTLGFFDMDLMSTFNQFSVGTSSSTAPKGGSPPKKLGPTVETSTMNGGVVSGHKNVGPPDTSTRRQGSMDMNSSSTPSIRVDSPTRSSESSSPGGLSSPRHSGAESRGRSPTYTTLAPGQGGMGETRIRSHSGAGSTDSLTLAGGVVLRNKDGKKAIGGTAAVRRSRNLDKNANLENMTRLSIAMSTPPAARRNKSQLPPPDVAPKPYNREVLPARSREDIALDGDDVGSVTEISEQDDYWEIDPLEKEWMLAAAQASMDEIHRLIMTDSYLVNRKDFIHGYTALHWAAKHGRCDIITMLIMSGAMVDIKSGGLTPLHLAAQSGHENAIHLLIKEHGASVNVREHGGRRPVDMLHSRVSEKTKSILLKYNNHGLPTPIIKVEQLSTFSQPHHKVSSLDRSWGSVGDLIDKRVETEKNKKRTSPKLSIRKSFSFKQKKLKEYSSSPKKDHRKENKKHKKPPRPLSEAVPYRYDV